MRRFCVVLMVLILQVIALLAQTPTEKVLPFLDENSFFLGRIQPAKIDIPRIMVPLVQKKVLPAAEAAALGFFLNLQKTNIEKVIDEIWFSSSTKDIGNYFLPSLLIKTKPGARSEDLLNLLKNLPLPIDLKTLDGGVVRKGQNTLPIFSYVIREEKGFHILEQSGAGRSKNGSSRIDMAKGFDDLGAIPFGAVLFPTKDNLPDLGRIFPSLKNANGYGIAGNGVLSGVKLVTMGVYLEPWKIQLVIQAENKVLANDLHKAILKAIQGIPDLIKTQVEEVGKDPSFKALAALVKSVSLQDDKITIVIDDFDPYFEIAARINEQNQANAMVELSISKVKNITSALLAYHREKGKFPPATTFSKDGKPLLSWRVQILPYLGHNLLYRQFRQNEPWDSEHNKKLIRRIPPVFRESKDHLDKGITPFLAPVGLTTVFPPDGTGTNSIQIANETSRTILLVKAPEDMCAIWTKPEDWEVDNKMSATDLLKGFASSVVFGFVDGSVKSMPLKDAEAGIKSMIAIHTK